MTIYWESLSQNAKDIMQLLGNFSPTARAYAMELKGYTFDTEGEGGKAYLDNNDLRNIAAGCLEVAQWLEERVKAEDEDV